MIWFLLVCRRRQWLAAWELRRLLRALRAARGLERDPERWATPRWVRRSLRRCFFWALCRLCSEQPALLLAGLALAPPAIGIDAWRLARAAWRLTTGAP